MSTFFVEVAVVLPVMGSYYYRVPARLSGEVAVGRQVVVPFARRRLSGYIVQVENTPPACVDATIRDILQVSSNESYFAEAHLPFYRWLSSYYLAPLGEVIHGVLPRGTRSDTSRAAFVSEAGRHILTQATATPEEMAVLSLLSKDPGLNLSQIRRHLPDHAVGQICRSLGRKRLILWEDQIREPSVKPRLLTVVRGLPGSSAKSLEEKDLKPRAKEILALLTERPRLLRDLCRQVANASYWVKKLTRRGLVSARLEEVYRDPVGLSIVEPGGVPSLALAQKQAVDVVCRALERKSFASFLLYGVTGSGKTEVYLAAAAKATRLGRQTLVLVPEIALTAQMEAFFRQRFRSRVAILHSGLGQGERRDEWIRVRRGEVDVVVGARSALFAPLQRLGLVVVDEEHDASFKEERGFRYHGRDAAVMRAKLEGAVVLMGSATPALTSYHNALQGKFSLLTLPQRIDQRPLPGVSIVDMRLQRKGHVLSLPLRQALVDTLTEGKQALLLINRRGYANLLHCRRCGHAPRCRNCAVSLTWHRNDDRLLCHLCGFAMVAPSTCPGCSAAALKPLGFGTQRVEAVVKRLFPEARVSRMDRDTTKSKQAIRLILRDLSLGRTDIVVGTQMIAKGHDFPNITLVGVVSADIALQWPDFRSAENTFQIVTQVAGRAGRGDSPGKVIVQTYNPEHYSIRFAKEHNYPGFFQEEVAFRKELGYPPYRRLILFRLAGNAAEKTKQAAQRLAAECEQLLEKRPDLRRELEVLGPVPAPLPRVKGKYRWQFLCKCARSGPLQEAGRRLLMWGSTALKGSGVSLSADMDPMSLI